MIAIERSREELLEKALTRIAEDEVDARFILECPNFAEDTFVVQDNINTCYLCRHSEPTVVCSHCNESWFEWQIESFGEDIDYQYEEGQNVICNDFGYSDFYACPNCLPKIRETIQQKRDEEEYYWRMVEEDYHRRQLT